MRVTSKLAGSAVKYGPSLTPFTVKVTVSVTVSVPEVTSYVTSTVIASPSPRRSKST